MSRLTRRGYTLLELILGSLIMMMVGGFGLYSLSHGRDSTQSKGLAEELAEELKAARQQAVAKQQPVALAFPGGPGGKSQSFYQLEGLAKPRLTRSISYAETYPQSCYYWGSWSSAVTEATTPTSTKTDFEVSNWTPLPEPADKMIVFTPSGSAVSNGLPLFGAEYRLLVSNGIQGGGTGAPTAVSKPYTVRISKAGGVTVERGVTDGVGIPDKPSLALGEVSNSVPVVAPSGGSPRITKVECAPKPEEKSAGGAMTVIPVQGYLTLTAFAEDPSGEPLTMRWVAQGPSGIGKFSSEKPVNMSWDAELQQWVGRLAWTPPSDAKDGEIYSLTCFVENPRGQQDQRKLAAGASVEVIPATRMAAVNTDEFWENYNIAWMNPEGTNMFNVTVPERAWEFLTPVWSPNGTKIAFYAGKDVPGGDAFEATLYLVNDDGTNLSKRFTCKGDITDYFFGPSFSPDGSRVAFTAYVNEDDYNDSKLFICNTFGSPNPRRLTQQSGDEAVTSDHTDVTWHPVDERYLMYTFTRYDASTYDYIESGIRVCNLKPPGGGTARSETVVETDDADDGKWEKAIGESHWARGGKRFVYTQGGKLFLLNFSTQTGRASDNSGDESPGRRGLELTPAGVDYVSMPRFSPGGAEVAFVDGNGHLWIVNADSSSVNRRVYSGGFVQGYNWSADGKSLILSTWADEADEDLTLWTVPHEGGAAKNVTPPNFRAWSTPSWAPGEGGPS